MVVSKPGKPDYSNVRMVISLLGVISKSAERTAAHLCCREKWSRVDTAAAPTSPAHPARAGTKMAGVLFTNVESAPNVCKAHLGRNMEALELASDLTRGLVASCKTASSSSFSMVGKAGKSGGYRDPPRITSSIGAVRHLPVEHL